MEKPFWLKFGLSSIQAHHIAFALRQIEVVVSMVKMRLDAYHLDYFHSIAFEKSNPWIKKGKLP